jgi:hypothetical protein
MPNPCPLDPYDEDEFCEKRLVKLRIGPFRFQVDYLHWCYRVLAYASLIPYLFFAWWLFSPWSPAWSSGSHSRPPAGDTDLDK